MVRNSVRGNWPVLPDQAWQIVLHQVACVELLASSYPGVVADLPGELVGADVDGVDFGRAVL